jgi:hypothetical protein
MERVIYELKYCERCGALGTRRSESSETYCECCAQILTRCFVPGRSRRGLARRAGRITQLSVRLVAAEQSAGGRPQ